MMSPTDPALVDAMASWVQEASSTLLAARADVPHKLLRWREAVRRFGHGHLRHAQSRPVLYPFSGADLLSALSLFSDAPSHTLVAPFPTGDARCFLSAACREQATSAAVSFFQNFADRGGGWTDDTASNGTVGVLPVLLVALHYSGRRVVTIEWYRLTTSIHGIALTCKHHGGSAPGSSGEGGPSSVESPTTRISYVRHTLGVPSPTPDSLAWLRAHALSQALSEGRRFTLLLKASPRAHELINSRPMAAALLAWSDFVVSDETGLLPSAYGHHAHAAGRPLESHDSMGRMFTYVSSYEQAAAYAKSGARGASGGDDAAPSAPTPGWRFRTYGNYSVHRSASYAQHGISYDDEARQHRSELERAFDGRGSRLPFTFGCGSAASPGLLLTAWRVELEPFETAVWVDVGTASRSDLFSALTANPDVRFIGLEPVPLFARSSNDWISQHNEHSRATVLQAACAPGPRREMTFFVHQEKECSGLLPTRASHQRVGVNGSCIGQPPEPVNVTSVSLERVIRAFAHASQRIELLKVDARARQLASFDPATPPLASISPLASPRTLRDSFLRHSCHRLPRDALS